VSVEPKEVDVSTILVEDRDVVRWLMTAADRDHHALFNSFDPHHCKLCDEPVPAREQRAHASGHRRELTRLAALQRRTATQRIKAVARLRREAKP
jgi:hypothetical protein